MARNPSEDNPESRPEEAGQLLAGHYEVTARVHQSAGRTTYEGRAKDTGKRVSITVFPPEVGRSDSDGKAFGAQVRLMKELTHPGIPDLLEAGVTDDGRRFLVHAHVDGRTLRDLLKGDGPLGPDRVAPLIMKVARVLSVARSGGVMHGNLKPESIRLVVSSTDLEAVVIPDVGVARLMRLRPGLRGAVQGTPRYLSPEQVQGVSDEPRTDIYALGVVAFEMLTGRVPYEGDDDEVMRAHVEKTPPSLKDVDAHNSASDMFQNLVTRMMARKPEARPAHGALLDEIAMLPEYLEHGGEAGLGRSGGFDMAMPSIRVDGHGPHSDGGPAYSAVPRPAVATQRTGVMAGAAGAAVVVVGIGIFLATRAPAPAAPSPAAGPSAPAPARAAPNNDVAVDVNGVKMRRVAKPAPAAPRHGGDKAAPAEADRLVTITVESDPPGALVMEGPIPRGTTPAHLLLPRGDAPRILSIRKEGFNDEVRTVVPTDAAAVRVTLKAAEVEKAPAPVVEKPAPVVEKPQPVVEKPQPVVEKPAPAKAEAPVEPPAVKEPPREEPKLPKEEPKAPAEDPAP